MLEIIVSFILRQRQPILGFEWTMVTDLCHNIEDNTFISSGNNILESLIEIRREFMFIAHETAPWNNYQLLFKIPLQHYFVLPYCIYLTKLR